MGATPGVAKGSTVTKKLCVLASTGEPLSVTLMTITLVELA